MYLLMGIDAVVRIAIAMAFFFIIVPALAMPRRPSATFLERFFWNLGLGITTITVVGQVLTPGRLFSLFTLLLVVGLIILIGQAAQRAMSPLTLLRQAAETGFLAFLNVLDRRVDVPRRIRRNYRRLSTALRSKTESAGVRLQMAGWIGLVSIAAGLRLYRPLATANLGFSDTYGHLYLLKLLEEGKQVDPAFGPYPHGLHFLLLAIHDLTNVDQILLLNFFGAFAGVLMTVAVAYVAGRIAEDLRAGLVAGFLFATLVGGASQYFVAGGVFDTYDRRIAAGLATRPYEQLVPTAGEFDLVLRAFQRQTSTLPQELAIALLFPAAMFLLRFLRSGERWQLVGYVGNTAAIAAVHSGVLAALILVSAIAALAAAVQRSLAPATFRTAVAWGAVAVVLGSAWAIAYVVYPYTGVTGPRGAEESAATYYFPFLKGLMRSGPDGAGPVARTYVTVTPFLIIAALAAIALAIASLRKSGARRTELLWIALVCLAFITIHCSATLGIPQVIEATRNSQWMIMAIMIVLGVAAMRVAGLLPMQRAWRLAGAAAGVVALVFWSVRIPRLTDPAIRDRIVNYSGYGTTALAVLKIGRSFQPFTWTLVSYGQEFPMVLRRGFHMPAVDFLDRYDPAASIVPIPTPLIFIVVEKRPHQFQINTWATRFSRADLEQRLQTWIYIYQMTHRDVRVFLEDEFVRVYQIERSSEEIELLSKQASR
jgi:hypothetical protein